MTLDLSQTVKLNEFKARFPGKAEANCNYSPIKSLLPPLGLDSSRFEDSTSTRFHGQKTSRASNTKPSAGY